MLKLFTWKKRVLISLGVQLTPAAFWVSTVILGERTEPGAPNLVGHTLFVRSYCATSHTKPLNSSVSKPRRSGIYPAL